MLGQKSTLLMGAMCTVCGCAVTPDTGLMPENVPLLYVAPETHATEELTCERMQLEFAYLNENLGNYPTDRPPPDSRTLTERALERGEDLIMDALMDQIDPAIQAYRILTDASETERKIENAKQRGRIRRAYVMGHMDALDCARDEKTILVAAKMAAGETLSIKPADEAAQMAVAARVDRPNLMLPDVALATLTPDTLQEDEAVEIEVEYVIVIEFEDIPQEASSEKIELAQSDAPALTPDSIEKEVREMGVPNIFDTPWQEGEEPQTPPDTGVPIASLEAAPSGG